MKRVPSVSPGRLGALLGLKGPGISGLDSVSTGRQHQAYSPLGLCYKEPFSRPCTGQFREALDRWQGRDSPQAPAEVILEPSINLVTFCCFVAVRTFLFSHGKAWVT